MNSDADNLAVGLPHSEILGSKPTRGSPRLIAACHVLHRLHAPRHSPNALKTLDRSHREQRTDDLMRRLLLLHVSRYKTKYEPTGLESDRSISNLLHHAKQRLTAAYLPTRDDRKTCVSPPTKMVEATGVEPVTSCLQSRRSTD